MTKIHNDKSKYIRRGVTAPKREIENNKERDYEIDANWHMKKKLLHVQKDSL